MYVSLLVAFVRLLDLEARGNVGEVGSVIVWKDTLGVGGA